MRCTCRTLLLERFGGGRWDMQDHMVSLLYGESCDNGQSGYHCLRHTSHSVSRIQYCIRYKRLPACLESRISSIARFTCVMHKQAHNEVLLHAVMHHPIRTIEVCTFAWHHQAFSPHRFFLLSDLAGGPFRYAHAILDEGSY